MAFGVGEDGDRGLARPIGDPEDDFATALDDFIKGDLRVVDADEHGNPAIAAARAESATQSEAVILVVPVNRRRRQAVYVAGLCAGLSGSFLTLGLVGKFGADGVSGRGFIAIAAVIFGGWTLRGTVVGAGVFGLFYALSVVLPALGHPVNSQLLNALPYAMTLATMLVLARRSRQPGALARPFVRGLT